MCHYITCQVVSNWIDKGSVLGFNCHIMNIGTNVQYNTWYHTSHWWCSVWFVNQENRNVWSCYCLFLWKIDYLTNNNLYYLYCEFAIWWMDAEHYSDEQILNWLQHWNIPINKWHYIMLSNSVRSEKYQLYSILSWVKLIIIFIDSMYVVWHPVKNLVTNHMQHCLCILFMVTFKNFNK